MSILSFFRPRRDTARVARERLQIVVAHQRTASKRPDYFPALQRDLLEVIRRYVEVDDEAIKVDLDQGGDCSVLELNVVLPEVAARN